MQCNLVYAMADSKRPLSVRVPMAIYQKLEAIASDTGQTISDVAVSMLGAGVGEDVATPGDRLTALESEVAQLRGKLRALAST